MYLLAVRVIFLLNYLHYCHLCFLYTGHRGPITDLSLSRSFSVTVPTTSVQERMVLFMTDLGEYTMIGFFE